MLCEKCQMREAAVHQTWIANGQQSESHLCAKCAEESGKFSGAHLSFPNINQLLVSLLGAEGLGQPLAVQSRPEPQCPACGLTYSQFAETGRLGCSQCYEHMEKQLSPLIRRIHNTTTHTGKVPKRTGGLVRLRKDLLQAKEELSKAVFMERFEDAAQIRDRIRVLEARLQAGGEGRAVE